MPVFSSTHSTWAPEAVRESSRSNDIGITIIIILIKRPALHSRLKLFSPSDTLYGINTLKRSRRHCRLRLLIPRWAGSPKQRRQLKGILIMEMLSRFANSMSTIQIPAKTHTISLSSLCVVVY